MKTSVLTFLLAIAFCGIAFAKTPSLPAGIKAQLESIKSDTGKIDFITAYVNEHFVKNKTLTDTLALVFMNEAEKSISKSVDNMRQYTVYNLLYMLHNDLKNTKRAASYKAKAGALYMEFGDRMKKELETKNQLAEQQQKELEVKNQTIQKQQGSLSKLGKENKEKEKIISETKEQLMLDSIESVNKEAQVKSLEQQQEIQELELHRKKTLNTIYFLLITLFVFVTGFVIKMYFNNKKFSEKLSEQNFLLAKEMKRSDELLLNILPEELAMELKQNGQSDARSHEAVSVMFTDFVDFSRMSELLTPTELVHEIDTCFKSFDTIISKYGIEKIKTVGDAYLCACGIPAANENHAENTVRAAIEIRDYMNQLKAERTAQGLLAFDLRIGIHSGPLVAGIVGIKKFAYDIWGDTVNIAARMESGSEAGKINVSESTYHLVKDKFYFISRGKIEAKNKGMIDMYFVELLS